MLRHVSGYPAACLVLCLLISSAASAQPQREFRLSPGLSIEKVAGAPQVRYPLFACFDDRGRLFVAEGTGTNLPGKELEKQLLGKITLLEDRDGDGRFESSRTFADKLVFPQGVLWHDGALYVASHPSIWRLEDSDGDGAADRREELVTRFNFNGNGCDIHGPFLGPDGWLYWTDGRHGYEIDTREGTRLAGKAARIFRCRPDGTRLERIAGGGFDNPVELVFTDGGDLIGTMDQGPGDCLLHYVEGGVYPRDDQPCMAEFVMTGPPLPPITQFSAALPAALCGLLRLRSDHLGTEYRGSLFTTQFNVHRVQQHKLEPDGATYRTTNQDFITSNDYDARFTDLVEDADGSLLLVDMGAWYNYGCPTAKIAKPEVLGAIYRIRRSGAPAVADPWGQKLALDKLPVDELAALLSDARLMLRDRAAEQLVKRGAESVEPLAAVVADAGQPTELRSQALWIVGRIETPSAQQMVRTMLGDKDSTLRSIAAHYAGLLRDKEALPGLAKMVVEDEPLLRAKAAAALGRIGASEAVPALLAGVRKGTVDRFLEHALIYALIEIDDAGGTRAALADPSPTVRRAGLVALDQMKSGALEREEVVAQLNTDDPDLQQAALAVISRHNGWSAELFSLVNEWLQAERLSPSQRASLAGALLAVASDESLQSLVATALVSPRTPLENRVLLLQAIAKSRSEKLPTAWLDALDRVLYSFDPTLQREAIAVVRSRNLDGFQTPLNALWQNTEAPIPLRIAALDCLAARHGRLDDEALYLLTTNLGDAADPLVRVAAARALGGFQPTSEQLKRLASLIEHAGPLTVPLVAPAFARNADAETGLALIAALAKSPGGEALTADELYELLARYPDEVKAAAQPLLSKLVARDRQQEAYLGELATKTLGSPGNPERGKSLFFSKKVGCYACHRVGHDGGSVGPDLSQIGRIRTTRALLEAVVFPSSTIVPDFRPYTIVTSGGVVHTGIVVRDSSDAVYLRTSQLAEIRVPRSEIESIEPSNVSIMPQGLEKTMTPQEFADLLEFLYQRR